MADTYFDSTGVLLFNGPAVISPVIKIFFKPFLLDENPEDGRDNERYIAVLSHENEYDWDNYIQRVEDLAEELLGPDIEISECESARDVLLGIARHSGCDLAPLIEGIDMDETVDLADVVNIVRSIQDGHNLSGFTLQGGWHCSKPRLWEFGGWAFHATDRYQLFISTADIRISAYEIDSHIIMNIEDAAMPVVALVKTLIDGVQNPELRAELKREVLARLNPHVLD